MGFHRELSDRFRWQGIEPNLPKSFSLVINHLEKSREIPRLCNLFKALDEDAGVKLLSHPVSWAWRRYASGGLNHEEVEFLLVSMIKVVEC